MFHKITALAVLFFLCFGARAQNDAPKPDGLPDVLPTMSYLRAMAMAEKGDPRGIRQAAVLIYLQSPYGDPEKDTTKGTWDITPHLEVRMNKWSVESAAAILLRAAEADFVNEKGANGTGLEACVWKTRMLKLSGDVEIDDQKNFRLKPETVVGSRAYWIDGDPCIDGEYLSACGRKFGTQQERNELYLKLSKSDQAACVERGMNWHLQPTVGATR